MKERADKVLADRQMVSSRSQAKSMIEQGEVSVNGVQLRKAGELIDPEATIQIRSPQYVGRGALKLEKALTEFAIDVSSRVLLDLGASTGGFTEVLLNRGASKVYAIDVGHDQLAPKLRSDPRVVNLEGTNIRDLTELPELADGGVMDLSFISITKVLGSVAALLKPQGFLVVLIKPQFEAGRERLPKDGVIKDPEVHEAVMREVIAFASESGWRCLRVIDSPIEGKAGNKEFLAWLVKG